MTSVTPSAKAQFSKRSSNILKGITLPISSGGFIKLEEGPLTITLKKNNEQFAIKPAVRENNDGWGVEATSKKLERQLQSLKPLVGQIPQAAFGHGQETVYDTSIRDALQLKGEEFEIGIPQEKLDEILTKVKRDLCLQTDIVAELYSLNVYQKGGKFVKHKDTPRGDDMLGTLVICLPSLFQGGAFSLSMGHINPTYFIASRFVSFENKDGGWYEWWSDRSANKKEVCLPWCAFYADVDHEIAEVTAGLRMTVAYLIRRKEEPPPDSETTAADIPLPRPIDAGEQAEMLREELGDALRNEKFLQDGGRIGSPCMHLYSNQEIFPGKKKSNDALTTKQIKKLKGRDLLLASVAASFGLNVYLVPYLSHECQGDMSDLRLPKFPKKKRCPEYMSEDDVVSFFDGDRPKEKDDFFGDPVENDADVWILPYGDSEQAEISVGSTDNYNAEGYYGNEASYTSFYVKSNLFLQVPEYSENRGQCTAKVEAQPVAKKARKVSP